MPDISMCAAFTCPLKENCYRYRAFPSEWQTYSVFPPGKDCNFYWPTEDGRRVRAMEEIKFPEPNAANIRAGLGDTE